MTSNWGAPLQPCDPVPARGQRAWQNSERAATAYGRMSFEPQRHLPVFALHLCVCGTFPRAQRGWATDSTLGKCRNSFCAKPSIHKILSFHSPHPRLGVYLRALGAVLQVQAQRAEEGSAERWLGYANAGLWGLGEGVWCKSWASWGNKYIQAAGGPEKAPGRWPEGRICTSSQTGLLTEAERKKNGASDLCLFAMCAVRDLFYSSGAAVPPNCRKTFAPVFCSLCISPLSQVVPRLWFSPFDGWTLSHCSVLGSQHEVDTAGGRAWGHTKPTATITAFLSSSQTHTHEHKHTQTSTPANTHTPQEAFLSHWSRNAYCLFQKDLPQSWEGWLNSNLARNICLVPTLEVLNAARAQVHSN